MVVTARNAAPGLFVQPGNPPAPYTVTDISTMWMIANVAETDVPALNVGQQVTVKVKAFPDRVYDGRISTIAQMVGQIQTETQAQAEFLLGEGCEEAQGFLYGEPLSAVDFEKYLRARQLTNKTPRWRRRSRGAAPRRRMPRSSAR